MRRSRWPEFEAHRISEDATVEILKVQVGLEPQGSFQVSNKTYKTTATNMEQVEFPGVTRRLQRADLDTAGCSITRGKQPFQGPPVMFDAENYHGMHRGER
jgi:hypothetical protein